MENVGIGERIKTLRRMQQLSQKTFADKIGITQSTLSSYENGNATPSTDILLTIAKQFQVSLDWLCGLSNSEITISSLGDVEKMITLLDELKEIRFDVEINEHFHNDLETDTDKWYASIKFYGNDSEHSYNASICQFLSSFNQYREQYENYFSDKETFDFWKTKTLETDSQYSVTQKEYPNMTFEERIRKRDALLEAKYRNEQENN